MKEEKKYSKQRILEIGGRGIREQWVEERIVKKNDTEKHELDEGKNYEEKHVIEKCKVMKMMYLNVSGLNKGKLKEIEMIMEKEDNVLFFMTETHMKYDSLQIESNLKALLKTRKLEVKKGSGLMVVNKRNAFDHIVQEDHSNPDIMIIRIEMKEMCMKIILVYF